MSQGGSAHIELPTTDLAASRRFYREPFGWTFEIVPGRATCAMLTPDGQDGESDAGPRAEVPSDRDSILHTGVEGLDVTLGQIQRAAAACPFGRRGFRTSSGTSPSSSTASAAASARGAGRRRAP